MNPIGIGIVGTGNIAESYVADLLSYPDIAVIGVTDIDPEKVARFADKHGVATFPYNESMFQDDRVQVVVNLTPHFAHKQVTEQALLAGKHVYSEKPLALTSSEAWALVELAQHKNRRLACSPFTMIGEAQQTAWKMIRDGKLGEVRMVYGEVNWGRIESWHPPPIPFYEVGPMFDVGVYVLGLVTTFFGPARRVQSVSRQLLPNRVTKDGQPFTLNTPDWMVTLIELANGTQVRLTTDFYVANNSTKQTGIEFHGDLGSLHLDSFFLFNSALSYAPFGEALQPVTLIREPHDGIPWGRGVHELVRAIVEERPHRFTGEQAAHITDILTATNQSQQTGQAVVITSSFTAPSVAEWAK